MICSEWTSNNYDNQCFVDSVAVGVCESWQTFCGGYCPATVSDSTKCTSPDGAGGTDCWVLNDDATCAEGWEPSLTGGSREYTCTKQVLSFQTSYVTGPLQLKIKGYLPTSGSDLPVYIWLDGTGSDTAHGYAGPGDKEFAKQMAARGYISAAVQWESENYPLFFQCPIFHLKADKVFKGTGSALGVICAMPRANCDRGVAVHGYSQGAHIAQLAATKDRRVTAALLFSMGPKTCAGIPFCLVPTGAPSLKCLQSSQISHVLPKSKRRYVIGREDDIFNHIWDGINSQALVSGVNCGRCDASHPHSIFPESSCGQDGSLSCLQADGSGYYIIGHPQRPYDHMWFQNYVNGELLEDFVATKQPWGMSANLDWLALAARVPSSVTAGSE